MKLICVKLYQFCSYFCHKLIKMEISIITICFLRMVLFSDAFFLNPRDITRMLRFFGPDPIPHRLGHYHPHYHRRHGNQEIHRNDKNSRYDPKENIENYDRYGFQNVREDRDKVNDKTPSRYQINGYYNHENCHHHDHQSYDYNRRAHKVPEDRYGKPPKNKRYEDNEDDDYYDSSNKQNKKRRHQKIKNQNLPKNTKYEDDDKENEEEVSEEYESSAKQKNYNYEKKATTDYYDKNREEKPVYYKKDYVTGVLVMLPKIRNEDDLPHHSRVARPQNLFFQNILKTEDDPHSHQHHLNEGEIIKSFILN